jgi:hypothetical protein
MHALIYLSLCLNIAVLVPVCLSILMRADWTTTAYGPDTPARGILLAIYFAILVYSAGLICCFLVVFATGGVRYSSSEVDYCAGSLINMLDKFKVSREFKRRAI